MKGNILSASETKRKNSILIPGINLTTAIEIPNELSAPPALHLAVESTAFKSDFSDRKVCVTFHCT